MNCQSSPTCASFSAFSKFHGADGGEQEKRTLVFGKPGGRSDPGGLGQRFGQDDTGNERISREMTGKHRVVAREKSGALRLLARFATKQLPNENKRRPVGEAREVIAGHFPITR